MVHECFALWSSILLGISKAIQRAICALADGFVGTLDGVDFGKVLHPP